MFLSLEIKTDLGWQKVILSKDASLHIEDVNPLLDIEAGGAFSYPFTICVETNQHIFPTLTNHHGAKVYDRIYHKPFRLSGGGYPLLYGIVDLDSEVEIEEQDDGTHTVAINLASNNQELSALLDGVNAQDIPVKDRIPVGTEFHSLDGVVTVVESGQVYTDPSLPRRSISIGLPSHIFSLNKYKVSLDGSGDWINPTNVSDPYPTKPYCNTMISIQKREKQEDGSYTTLREYECFDADRQNSGICFYVMYFFDCLFTYFNIAWDKSLLVGDDYFNNDFCRLAFFTTKCECDAVPSAAEYKQTGHIFGYPGLSPTNDEFVKLFEDYEKPFVSASSKIEDSGHIYYFDTQLVATAWTKYANSKNFPDTDALSILKDIQNTFGVRFIYDSEGQHCRAIFIKDVFNDKTAVRSGAIIHGAYHKDQNTRGVKMTYDGGDDDTSYNYDPNADESKVIIREGFASIKNEKGAYDKNTYYDKVTGNMYRIKVDDDAKTEEELYPSLLEVGQFRDAWVGDITEEKKEKEGEVKTVEVSYNPVVNNVVEYVKDQTSVQTTGGRSSTMTRTSQRTAVTQESCKYTVFIDLEISDAESQRLIETVASGFSTGDPRTDESDDIKFKEYNLQVQYKARYGYTEEYLAKLKEYKKAQSAQRLRTGMSKPIPRYNEDPLATYDAGYMLGIMRGPGNDAGVDVVQDNYDGNGNARWAFVPTGYAFTSDSIDQFGQLFDYNGTGEGGLDPDKRFSLKLEAEKVLRFLGEKTSNNSVLVRTPQEAAYWLSYLFSDNPNIDILSLHPKTSAAMTAKGWSTAAFGDYVPVYPVLEQDIRGNTIMLNAIKPNAQIFTPAELMQYAQKEYDRRGHFYDSENVLIKTNATQQEVDDLIGLAKLYYFPDTAEPYTLTNVPETATTDYYPINAANAHRGLLHKFNYEYFWFLINARAIVLELSMPLQEIRSLDKLRWHTFGQYTGLIERLEYDLDNQTGLSHVTLTLRYL